MAVQVWSQWLCRCGPSGCAGVVPVASTRSAAAVLPRGIPHFSLLHLYKSLPRISTRHSEKRKRKKERRKIIIHFLACRRLMFSPKGGFFRVAHWFARLNICPMVGVAEPFCFRG